MRQVVPNRVLLPLALTVALLLGACKDPVDKAAKARIFSPEDPAKSVASAQEKLSPEQVADDVRVARRILEMPASEAVERIGANRYAATVSFDWSAQSGAQDKLSENRVLVSGPGGVNGDFDAKVQNGRGMGLEVIRVEGKVYANNTYGKSRFRARDRGMAERTREDVYGALREFTALFGGRLKLSPQGTVTHEGRTAWRYDVSLGPVIPPEPSASRLPKAQPARAGMDEGTRRRQFFSDKRQVRALSGEVLVDAQSSVVVKVRLDGKIDVPPQGAASSASLHMAMESALTQIGKTPALKPPADFLPDQDKPSGIADALDRFGIPRGNHVDGGSESEPADEEP